MLSAFRNLSKSAVGTIIMVLFLLAILASFALADIQSVGSGTIGGGSSGTLASAGKIKVTDKDLDAAMQRRLADIRAQNPEADYSAIAGDFDPILAALIQDRALLAFADKHDIALSKRLIDAEIAKLPAVRGLDGRFSDQAYAQFLQSQRLTDAELRQILSGAMIQRLVLAPAAANARVPVGLATPYASMLLEQREAEVQLVPTERFAAGIGEPSAADLQAFYNQNRARYMVPEQRVLTIARIGPEQVANVQPTDAEIAAYYKANQATYGGTSARVISQIVSPSQQAANAVAARAKGSGDLGPQKIAVGAQTREQLTSLAGPRVATAVFSAQPGAIVGPIQSDLGWHVIKVESVRNEPGRSLESVRGEIAAKLAVDKRKEALTDLVTRIEDSIADGASFAEAVRGTGVPVVRTPPVTAGGVSRSQPEFKLPPELTPALRGGFDIAADDDPIVETLPNDAGYALVGVEEIIPAAPAPLASIGDQVAADWKKKQASDKARAAATAIAARVAKGGTLQAAAAASPVALPSVEKASLQRMDLAQMQGQVPPAIAMIFSLAQGRSRMIADPQGRGFVIVKVNKITPGNARLQPTLINRTQAEFQQTASGEYAEQMTRAIEADVGVKRNDKAIAAAKRRITGSGS